MAAFVLLVVLLGIATERALQLLQPEGLAGGVYQSHNAQPFILATGIGLALLVLLSAAPARLARVLVVGGAALAAVGVLAATAFLGGRWLDIASALLTFTACWAVGTRVLRVVGTPDLARIAPIAFTAGGGVLGLLIFALGKLDLLYWWTLGLFLLFAGGVGAFQLSQIAWRHRRTVFDEMTRGPLESSAFAILCALFCWIAIYAAAPEVTYDPLYAKAWLPQLWAETHSIGPLLQHPVMGNAGYSQILAVPGHLLGGHGVGRYLQLTAWVGLASTVWWFGRSRGAVGPLAAVAALAVPAVIWQATNANDDLLLSLVLVGLALAVLRSPVEQNQNLQRAMAIGLLAGACILFKLHLLPLAAMLALGWALSGGRHGAATRVAGLLIGGAAIALPTFVQRWIELGNPVFPNYNAIFRSSNYAPVNDTFNLPFWQHPSATDALLTPWYAVWQPDRLNEMAPPGMFGALIGAIVLLLAIGWMRWDGRRQTIVPWAAVGVAVLAWWISLRYLRYLLPAGFVSMLAVLMFASPKALGRRGSVTAAMLAAMTATVALVAFVPISFMIPERKPPISAALGRWNQSDYLRVAFPERDTLVAFNRLAPKGAMAVSVPHQRTWLTDGRDLTPGWELLRRLNMGGPFPSQGPGLRRRMDALGVGWVITNMSDPVTVGFLKAGAEPVFGSNGLALFRLTDDQAAGRPRSCDPRFLGRPKSCWAETQLDRKPGLSWNEDPDGAIQTVTACPGTTIEIAASAIGPAAPSGLIAQSASPDPRAGTTSMSIPPGTTARTFLTVPPGANSVTIHAIPGDQGTVTSMRLAVHGPSCRAEGRAP